MNRRQLHFRRPNASDQALHAAHIVTAAYIFNRPHNIPRECLSAGQPDSATF